MVGGLRISLFRLLLKYTIKTKKIAREACKNKNDKLKNEALDVTWLRKRWLIDVWRSFSTSGLFYWQWKMTCCILTISFILTMVHNAELHRYQLVVQLSYCKQVRETDEDLLATILTRRINPF
ncbi:unnamed protein product [Brugia timori]|uniref:Secreted protein n=1 Tax=Brugia timori TaxID=42155 RepID=A0A0R3QS30_9BILA|nr:unnamed protein product [Brugia timori]